MPDRIIAKLTPAGDFVLSSGEPEQYLRTLVRIDTIRAADGALLVQVDTKDGAGHIRVNVNDITVFDAAPEAPEGE